MSTTQKTRSLITVVGGVGSGKTTLLDSLSRQITEDDGDIAIKCEPIELWGNILESYYNDPIRLCFDTELLIHSTMNVRFVSPEDQAKNIHIRERGETCCSIFVDMNNEDNHLSDTDKSTLYSLFNRRISQNSELYNLEIIVYLQTSIDNCYKRVAERKTVETMLPPSFYEKLNKKHDDLYSSSSKHYQVLTTEELDRIIPISGTQYLVVLNGNNTSHKTLEQFNRILKRVKDIHNYKIQ